MKNPKLNQSNEAKATIFEMACQAAHDLRSPLSALNMIVSAIPQIDDEKRAMIRQALERINGIAEDLLANFREAGPKAAVRSLVMKSEKEYSDEEVASLIQSLTAEKQAEYGQLQGVRIEFKEAAFVGARLRINEKELKRTLSNLINNSVEAGCKTVAIQFTSADAQCSIAVEDDGGGIPEDILLLLNSPMRMTFGKRTGNGLGLSHAKSAVGAMKGTLRVRSRLGAGTSIQIQLPAAHA